MCIVLVIHLRLFNYPSFSCAFKVLSSLDSLSGVYTSILWSMCVFVPALCSLLFGLIKIVKWNLLGLCSPRSAMVPPWRLPVPHKPVLRGLQGAHPVLFSLWRLVLTSFCVSCLLYFPCFLGFIKNCKV